MGGAKGWEGIMALSMDIREKVMKPKIRDGILSEGHGLG